MFPEGCTPKSHANGGGNMAKPQSILPSEMEVHTPRCSRERRLFGQTDTILLHQPHNLSDPKVEAPYGAKPSGTLFPPNTKDNSPFDGHSFNIEYLTSIESRFLRDGYSVYIEYANLIIKYGAQKGLVYEIKKGEEMKKGLLQAAWEHYRAWAEKVRLMREKVRGGEIWKEGGMEEAWNVEREMGELCRQMALIDWLREAQELGHPASRVFGAPMGELSEVMPFVNCYL
ncbi:hypothetical protein BGX38DRAFT_1277231 [Terfezia claveryi]|nr:hypothetical protein BGX38DRAFT_1277231 [Terfezia claveryi]